MTLRIIDGLQPIQVGKEQERRYLVPVGHFQVLRGQGKKTPPVMEAGKTVPRRHGTEHIFRLFALANIADQPAQACQPAGGVTHRGDGQRGGEQLPFSRLQTLAKKSKVEREPTEEIDLLDTMLASLVDLLIEKGIITEEEYEKKIKGKVKVK